MSDVATLVRLIEAVSGNVVPDRDFERVETIARTRARATGHRDLESYLRWLRFDTECTEWRHLLSRITINESYLFRAPQQFRAVSDVVLPDLASRRLSYRCLRVWSAGCARGEEAVTLAVVLAESTHLVGWKWQIIATDVDAAVVEDARRGRFGARAMAKVPTDLLQRYFVPRGDTYELDPLLRQRIDFRVHNLMQPELGFESGFFDLVFLRNVLIYFRPESQRRVATAVARTLADDGYLFLGPSESLWQMGTELAAMELDACFCYRKAATPAATGPAAAGQERIGFGAPLVHFDTPLPLVLPPLLDERTAEPEPQPAVVEAKTGTLVPVVEALAAGRVEAAAELIADALTRYPESPTLRAYQGLAYDVRNNTQGAVRAYRAALYLDPSLFQVRYLHARCLQRMGWPDRARDELQKVMKVLSSTDCTELHDWSELGLPSRCQVEARCQDELARLG